MSIKVFLTAVLLTAGVSGTAMAAGQSLFIENIQAPMGMIYDQDGNLFVAEWGG